MESSEMFDSGLRTRREVLGADYVDSSLAQADDFMTALGKSAELKLHVKGALANGATVDEIKEVLLHACVYCGIPAGLEAFRSAHEALLAEGAILDGRGE